MKDRGTPHTRYVLSFACTTISAGTHLHRENLMSFSEELRPWEAMSPDGSEPRFGIQLPGRPPCAAVSS